MKKTYLIIAWPFIIMLNYTDVNAHPYSLKPKAVTDTVLTQNRKKIDSLDQLLIQVLGERERVVKEIGIYKAKKNIPSLQAARFDEVLKRGVEAGKKEGLSEEFITELLNAVHKESLRIEDSLKRPK